MNQDVRDCFILLSPFVATAVVWLLYGFWIAVLFFFVFGLVMAAVIAVAGFLSGA